MLMQFISESEGVPVTSTLPATYVLIQTDDLSPLPGSMRIKILFRDRSHQAISLKRKNRDQ